MKLNVDVLRELIHGAMQIEEVDGKVYISRFTSRHKALFVKDGGDANRGESLTSVHLHMETDATYLKIAYTGAWCSTSRPFFFFDLWIDDVLCDHQGYMMDTTQPGRRFQPDGEYTFQFPAGMKQVSLFFPEMCHVELASVEVDDGATVLPVKHEMTILAFGDSITEGHDVLYAGMEYIDHVARAMHADLYNMGIGGSRFRTDILVQSELPDCDMITVAYGTNDYRHATKADFEREMPAFFRMLSQMYPGRPVYVITPIWRHVITPEWQIGTLDQVRQAIRKEAEQYPDFHVIDGAKLVPHFGEFYYDGTLHPNDLGHSLYAMNLLNAIREQEK